MESFTVICPACGKEILVPSELEEFSCVYCGAKHRLAEQLPSTLPADDADRVSVETHLLDCIRDFPNAYKQFNRKQYEAFYQTHKEAVAPTFESMERWACAQPTQHQSILEGFAELFVQQWEDYHQNHPKAKTKHARGLLECANKMTLALFTVPAIRSLGLSISEEFPLLLRDRFNETYPDNRFELATFEVLNSGFRKRWTLFGKKKQ